MTDAAASSNGAAPAPVADVVPTEKYLKEQARAVDAEKRLEAFKDIDPVAFKAMREDYELMRKQQTGGDPKKIEELITAKEAEIRTTVQKTLDERDAKINNLSSTLKRLQVTDKVFSLAASRINEDCADDFKSYAEKYGDLGDDGEIIFKDDKGAMRYAPGSTTKPMGVDDFVEYLSNLKPSWFKPDGKAGAKTAGQKTSAASNARVLTWAEIGQLPDKGKIYMQQLANTDKTAFNALMQEAKF